jgi:hypothetical protein
MTTNPEGLSYARVKQTVPILRFWGSAGGEKETPTHLNLTPIVPTIPRSTTMKTFVVSPPLLLLLSLIWWADGFHAMESLSMIVVPSLTKNRPHRRLPSPNQNPRNPRHRVSGTRFSQQQQQQPSSATSGGRVPLPTTTTLQTVSGDLPTDPHKDESIQRRQKVYATTFNLVKAIAGSGILALPGGVAAMSDYKSR